MSQLFNAKPVPTKSVDRYPMGGYEVDLRDATPHVYFQGRYIPLHDCRISGSLKPDPAPPQNVVERMQREQQVGKINPPTVV